VALTVPVGSVRAGLTPFWAQICRNDACAVVDAGRLPDPPGGLVVPLDGQRSDALLLRLVTDDQGGVSLLSSWAWLSTDPNLEDGDVYSMRVVDARGLELGAERKVATHEHQLFRDPFYGTCPDGIPIDCLSVTLADAPPGDAGAFPFPDGGLPRDAGPSTDAASLPDAASADATSD
jgi:hypothetical protein